MIISIPGFGNVNVEDKTFKTGSTGHYGNAKLTGKHGERVQWSVQGVLIGSKPKN
jgi:hypothetical protein